MNPLRALPRVSPLVLGTALIAMVAFAGSTSHVLKLAEANGQGGWLAWTIAGTVEALAVLSAMEIRHRVRHGMPRKAPTAVLVSTVVFLLAANLATANGRVLEHVWIGWGLAVVQPTVLLLALALIETRPTSRRNPRPAPSIGKAGRSDSESSKTIRPAAPVVPDVPKPLIGADPSPDPQKSRVASVTSRGTPTARVIAEEVAALCDSPGAVIEQTKTVLDVATYAVSEKTAERVRKYAREIIAAREQSMEVAR